LKEQLRQSEACAAEQKRQLGVLNARFEDTTKDLETVASQLQEAEEKIEQLKSEKQEVLRECRGLESIYEAERASMMKEKDVSQQREEELLETIDRLKESLSAKQLRGGDDDVKLSRPGTSRACVFGLCARFSFYAPSPNCRCLQPLYPHHPSY